MAATVHMSTPFLNLTGGRAALDVPAGSIEEIVRGLDQRFPGLAGTVMAEGKIRGFILIFINDRDIGSLDGEKTVVRDGDEVFIMPAIAGG